jgi:hypothetical protein
MLSEQEQDTIRLISDKELYPQAVECMQRIGKTLSQTQVNGLLNVSLANTYEVLTYFVQKQGERSTWSRREEHVKTFYKHTFPAQLKRLETYLPIVLKYRGEPASHEDEQAIKMTLAREFIQHLLAENSYKSARDRFENHHQPDPKTHGQPRGKGDQHR